ncbi:MAG: hypothetical protein MI919_13525 [Holophagales bacterium]|nr:hypothetical protein [Holophagales bacterium]
MEERNFADKQTAIAALTEHMGTLKASTDWGIMVAVIVMLYGWASSPGRGISLLGVSLDEKAAYIAAALVFTAVIVVLAIHLSRTKSILALMEELLPEAVHKGYTIDLVSPILTFSWIFNPFCYYGRVQAKKVESRLDQLKHLAGRAAQSMNWGLGGFFLATAFWIGYIGLALISLSEQAIPTARHVLKIVMLLAGFSVVLAAFSVLRKLSEMLALGRDRRPSLPTYESTVCSRVWGLALGQTVGVVFYLYLDRSLDSWKIAELSLLLLLYISFFMFGRSSRRWEL